MKHRIQSLLSILLVAVFLISLAGIRPANGENGSEEGTGNDFEQGQESQTGQGTGSDQSSGGTTDMGSDSGQDAGDTAGQGTGSDQSSGGTTDMDSDSGQDTGDAAGQGADSDQGAGSTTDTDSGSGQDAGDTAGQGTGSDQGAGSTTDTDSGSGQDAGGSAGQGAGSDQSAGDPTDTGSGSGQDTGDAAGQSTASDQTSGGTDDTGADSSQDTVDAAGQGTGSDQTSGGTDDTGADSSQDTGDAAGQGTGSDQTSGDTADTGSGSDSDQEGGPDAAPEPAAIPIAAAASEGIVLQDGAFVVPQGQDGYIAFSWSFSEPFDLFRIKLTQRKDQGNVIVYEAAQTDSFYSPSVSSLSAGNYVFSIYALADGTTVGTGTYHFTVVFSEGSEEGASTEADTGETAPGQEESVAAPTDEEVHGKEDRGGGAARGGGRTSSGSASSQSVQTSRVTAGKALSTSHASGSKTMEAFGAVDLSFSGESMTALFVHGRPGIQLDGGEKTFTAVVEEEKLVLKPELTGEVWAVNGYMLTALARSGITEISMMTEAGETLLLTEQDFQGNVYAALCAGGVVSGDYEYLISGGCTQVLVADSIYSIDDSNMLVPVK